MKGWTEWGERTRDELDGPNALADELNPTRLVLEDDRVIVREELLPRRRGNDPFLQPKAACLSAPGKEGKGGGGRGETNIFSDVLENVGLERHVHVDRSEDVAQLTLLNVEHPVDMLRLA